MINLPVLVLNQTYEPLNVCRVRRAIVLLSEGKAEMLENGYGYVRSATARFPVPSVIKLAKLVRRPRPQKKLNRFEVFMRDGYMCQYCRKKTRQLTIDHVIPRYRGGKQTWENMVSACVPCNRRKAGRTPTEAGMRLIDKPQQPRDYAMFYLPHDIPMRNEWQKYIVGG